MLLPLWLLLLLLPQAEEKLAVAGSWPVAVARALRAALGLGSSGYEVTAPVEATPAGTRFYVLQARRYVLDEARGAFGAARNPEGICARTYADLLHLGGGLMGDQVSASLDACGPNRIPFGAHTPPPLVLSPPLPFALPSCCRHRVSPLLSSPLQPSPSPPPLNSIVHSPPLSPLPSPSAVAISPPLFSPMHSPPLPS